MATSLRSVQVTPAASDVLQVYGQQDEVLASITIVVVPDAAPTVRITAPAADLRRDAATGSVPILITAQDDLGLRDLRLRFTKVSGSGESFTFEDGEWPVQVRRASERQWTGSHQIDLAALGLGPGDSIVYHAVAHDARVGAEGAAESERFLIEITRPGALAAGDFSLPEPEEKFALSQRMVIQLTERLLEKRPRMSAEAFGEEAQALAVAQRRVRAEFVFMLGGEVEDEFEEAAHAHEVEEGRAGQPGQGRSDRSRAPDVAGRDAADGPRCQGSVALRVSRAGGAAGRLRQGALLHADAARGRADRRDAAPSGRSHTGSVGAVDGHAVA